MKEVMKKNATKIIIGFAILLIVLILLIVFLSKKVSSINYQKYQELLESKEDFVLYLGSKSCTHCIAYKPTLNKVIAKYKLTVYYLDVSTLSEEEYDKVSNKTLLKGTPTVAFFKGGSYQSSPKIVGEASYEETVQAFKDFGYIK